MDVSPNSYVMLELAETARPFVSHETFEYEASGAWLFNYRFEVITTKIFMVGKLNSVKGKTAFALS